MELSTVRFEQRDRVGWLTLDRPASRNALTEDVVADLERVIGAVRADRSLRALVVTGAGDAFCIGMDLSILRRAFADLTYFRAFLDRLNGALLDLEALDLPVVAMVNGLTRAGGFELLLACDLVVVADEARIADDHAHFGLLPGGGSTQRAPRKLGDQQAKALLFSGRWLDGAEAVRAGLALRAVPRAELEAAVEELLADLRPKSRECLGALKTAMRAGAGLEIGDAVQVEVEHLIRYLAEHPDGPEGFYAYLERRPPSWER